jgi:predicted nucleic acid-binding protein
MILVDAGPLVALFDPRDNAHHQVGETLLQLADDLITTVPVLTEAMYMLAPASRGARSLRTFVAQRGLAVWWLSGSTLARAFRLMDDYGDQSMDLADASLVAAAENLRTTKIFTLDRRDFLTYRAKIGRSSRPFTLV